MTSVIIPVYKEPYLNLTIDSLLEGAMGEVEIVVIFDGPQEHDPVLPDKRVKIIKMARNEGLRAAINNGVLRADGEWIMKTDAHCAFAPGWDLELKHSTKSNWLMVPRRYSLDEEKWEPDLRRPVIDYNYLSFPGDKSRSMPKYGYSFQVMSDSRKTPERIDDTMAHQGSCWFANKDYFMKHIFPLDDINYGPFAQEHEEIGLKYWLGGGAVKVNKNTWYAHLSKRQRHYDSKEFSQHSKRAKDLKKYNEWATQHWMGDNEPGMKYKFEWLVEKFWPLPGWPDNWKETWKEKES